MENVKVRECEFCTSHTRPDDERCWRCGHATGVSTSRGVGTLYSWTTVHISLGDRAETPYTVVVVDLIDGARVLGSWCPVASADRLGADVSVGACVHSHEGRLEFAPIPDKDIVG